MKKILLLFFILILIPVSSVNVQSITITEFIVDGNTVYTYSYPPNNIGYIDIPEKMCLEQGSFRILGQETNGIKPMPLLDIGNDGSYNFRATMSVEDVVWSDNWCGGYDCDELVPLLNGLLSACNEEQNSICSIPVRIENNADGDNGIITLTDLELNLIDSYRGPLINRGVCDLDYVCNAPDEDSCFAGLKAEVMLANQRTVRMTDCNIYFPEYEYNSNHCTQTQNNAGLISVQDSITHSGMEFAIEFFRLNPFNNMGALLFTVNVPPGQLEGLTNSLETVQDRLEKTLAQGTNQPCITCGLYYASEEFTKEDNVNRSIILLGDGVTNRCHQWVPLDGGSTGPQCGTEGALRQAIQYAEYLYNEIGITTYSIGYGLNPREEDLRAISTAGGGEYFPAENIEELVEVYKLLARIVTGDCTRDCRYDNPPFEPELGFCGDGFLDPGEECDWGTENKESCAPGEGETCWVCLPEGNPNACTLASFSDNPPEDPEYLYCGDGRVDNPNSDGEPEQCDRGSENKDSCTPIAGGQCSVCTLDCRELTINQPTQNPCITLGASSPTNLNSLVTYDDGRSIDLEWTIKTESGLSYSHINDNNVLVVSLLGNFGQMVLGVRDSDGRTDEVCLNFVRSTSAYGVTEDPFTRLQIAKGRLVSGYYEEELTGRVIEYGPYLITAQVWQR